MIIYVLLEAVVGMALGIWLAVRTKKAEGLVYGRLDKTGRITNILLALIYLVLSPMYLFIGAIAEPNHEGFLGFLGLIVGVIIASTSFFCSTGLGLSVAWRRQGKSKGSFLVQFAGLASTILTLVLYCICLDSLITTLN